MQHVVIYGGSFNPPTLAHVGVLDTFVESRIAFDEILVVPTFEHAYGKNLASYDDRVEMCWKAFQSFLRCLSVSLLDKIVVSEPRGSMYSTCSQLLSVFPKNRISLIVGQDQAEEIVPRWHRGEDLMKLVDILVVPRADKPLDFEKFPWLARMTILPQISTNLRHISSTGARRALCSGDIAAASEALPQSVITYCQEKGLYHA